MKTSIVGIVLWFCVFTQSVFGDYSGPNDTFYGNQAGAHNTTGVYNTFIGESAGYSNIDGFRNTFIGDSAGYANTSGYSNSFLGNSAGHNNTTGNYNIFLGEDAGRDNTTGYSNSYIGYQAGSNNKTGSFNTFVGHGAGLGNPNKTTGNYNSFIGAGSGNYNETGYSNSFIGFMAGARNRDGYSNTFLGYQAGHSNDAGYFNTFVGLDAGFSNTSGIGNSYLGLQAGYGNTAGIGNVFLGFQAGYSEKGNNRLYIANSLTTSPLIYGEFDNQIVTINGNLGIGTKTPTAPLSIVSPSAGNLFTIGTTSTIGGAGFQFTVPTGGAWNFKATMDNGFKIRDATNSRDVLYLQYATGNVGIGTNAPAHRFQVCGSAGCSYNEGGLAWINASSREYKENIQALGTEVAMEALMNLNPVTFTYKTIPEQSHVGFVAEEVPDIVAMRDRKGLSPMDIVAVLTKVVQEQQRLVQEQQKAIEEQQRDAQEQQKTILSLREELDELKRKVK